MELCHVHHLPLPLMMLQSLSLHLLAGNNRILSFTVLSLGPSVKILLPLSLKLLLLTLRLPLPGPHLPPCLPTNPSLVSWSLKDKLAYTTRGSKSVSDYLHDIKSLTDELALISHPLDDVDLVIHALNGLGSDFKEITTALKARDIPVCYEESFEKLSDYERYLKREDSTPIDLPIAIANAFYPPRSS
ncbi:hypothetical protein L6164_008598 [Bauhinia variegata]|uniref:Uncharacterized protein n=1 Tax=Bauhinia variegata TaxID=167791 RepID=A0ACB9PG82_BAUVA|nr:hypothetical protein L6164_008598 [Bauhinia variegata]